jgi:hypothetical protein
MINDFARSFLCLFSVLSLLVSLFSQSAITLSLAGISDGTGPHHPLAGG